MRRDYLSNKYIILLNEIIADYDKNKSEKRGRKNKFNNLFYLKRILSVLLSDCFNWIYIYFRKYKYIFYIYIIL